MDIGNAQVVIDMRLQLAQEMRLYGAAFAAAEGTKREDIYAHQH